MRLEVQALPRRISDAKGPPGGPQFGQRTVFFV